MKYQTTELLPKESIHTETLDRKISAICEEKTQNRYSRIGTGKRNDTNRRNMEQIGTNRNNKKKYGGLHLGHWSEALYQMTRAEYKTEPDKKAIKELIRQFNEYFLSKRNVYYN